VIVDKIGQEIKPGCLIAYALSNSGAFRVGKVLATARGEHTPYGRPRPWYEITVRGTEDRWRDAPPTLTTKNGTLTHPDRVLVLDTETVPAAYRELLDPVPLI
jgi:hypothetical protein